MLSDPNQASTFSPAMVSSDFLPEQAEMYSCQKSLIRRYKSDQRVAQVVFHFAHKQAIEPERVNYIPSAVLART